MITEVNRKKLGAHTTYNREVKYNEAAWNAYHSDKKDSAK